MNQVLYKATIEGNVESLIKLIQEDPLILDRTNITTTSLETPLHIAAMLGHEQFAIELLRQKPQLARELDSRRSSPLHLASAKGHLGIVKALLQVDPDTCFACDRDGKNPVHIAAMRGRIEVVKEMLLAKPDAARAIMSPCGETTLHLCVEYSQFEALKVLMGTVDFGDLVNRRDGNGNTVLHLAVADKQVQTTEFLLSLAATEVNTMNLSGMTPMDILIQRKMDTRDSQIEQSLAGAGAGTSVVQENHYPPISIHQIPQSQHSFPPKTPPNDIVKNNEDWLERKRSALMVVASLIATMAFQAGVEPPEGVWRKPNRSGARHLKPQSLNGFQTIIYEYLKAYVPFYAVNTLSFIASLSIILLLMSGLPLNRFMWILMLITWISITAIALSYTISVILQTPDQEQKSIINVVGVAVFVWICLMVLLLVGHTFRFIVRMVKLMVRALTPKRRVPYGSPPMVATA